jgi:NADH-quinone oxidoreductase subunit M
MELFPEMLKEWSPFLLGLAIAGVFYGGLAAWMQNDFKRLIAYSSFSHMNFILAGLFIWHEAAQTGAILQSFNHAITIAGLFLVAGWLEERVKTTAMSSLGGLAKYMPYLCWLTLIFVLSSVALPGTNSFIGELMILFGLFGQNPYVAAVLGLSIILSVIYMLRYMQRIYFGAAVPLQTDWTDIGIKELLIAAPIVALIFAIGLYPTPLLDIIKPAIDNILTLAHGEPS